MSRVLSVVSASLCLISGAANAATHWRCDLSDDAVRLVCMADPGDSPPEADPAPTARVRGTSFPLDPAEVYQVDLWTPPSDPEWLALLARSTICHRSPGCTVSVTPLRFSSTR